MRKMFDLAGKSVYVAGHRGMVGAAIVRRLKTCDCKILTAGKEEVDLLIQADTENFLRETKPDVVIVAAAKVGGIHANSTYPAEFLRDNLGIELNVIHGAYKVGVQKLLFLGSSCIYPRLAHQPMNENELLTGPLEPTNEWYSIAKIAGVKLCQAYRRQYGVDYISVMPTNLYGPGDNYHPENSHVVAALIQRFHDAKISGESQASVWGTGQVQREFLFVDDLADACVFVLQHYSDDLPINIGTGSDLSIADFANLIAEVIGFSGKIVFDPSRPDGVPRKLLDISRIATMGWSPTTPLRTGISLAYADFIATVAARRQKNAGVNLS